MDDDRLIALETKIAYQEAALQNLSDTLVRQQALIEQLERTCRHLLSRVASAEPGVFKGTAADEVPPHY